MIVSAKKSALYLKSYFKQIGIQEIVICPGSRNLPLIVNFSNDQYFKVYSIIDERVAGFFALGMVKAVNRPVVVITTSGSAAINLAPAMAEAFYQRLPLIAMTADRPASFINKGENQTIIQHGLFSNYVGLELDIEENIDFSAFEKKIQMLHQYLGDPTTCNNVHMNLPFSEPIDEVENVLGDFQFKLISERTKNRVFKDSKLDIKKGQNVIIYFSNYSPNSKLNEILDRGVQEKNWVVISEMHSGWYHKKIVSQIDLILARTKDIQNPDILITIGETMLSKRFRNYIKSLDNIIHFDISLYPRNWDNLSPKYQRINLNYNDLDSLLTYQNTADFQSFWLQSEDYALRHLSDFSLNHRYKEFNLMLEIVDTIDRESFVYWGNSSIVRYGNWSNWKYKSHLTHLTNRGVSGIEGVLAAAIGYRAMESREDFYCILGDISLLYESNSLSALSFINNIKIIVINNHGGKIFMQIHHTDTLGNSKALMTPHNQNFEKLANIYDLKYFKSIDLQSFISQWELVKASTAKLIFEISLADEDVDLWRDYFS